MNAVERAAEVIRDRLDDVHPVIIHAAAQALVAAGWHDGPKLTDADRAVLDAAKVWAAFYYPDKGDGFEYDTDDPERALVGAIRRREATP